MHPDDKELRNPKLLQEVKMRALSNKDIVIPEKDADLYQASMWTLGVVQTLWARGYEIKKKDVK